MSLTVVPGRILYFWYVADKFILVTGDKKQAAKEKSFKHFQKWVTEPLEEESKVIRACG